MAPRTVAGQAPLSMESSRQEHWSGLPFPTSRDLPNSEIEPESLVSATLAGGSITTNAIWHMVDAINTESVIVT